MKTEAILTPSEIEILQQAREDPDIFTGYFFKKGKDDHGFLFDYNFVDEGKWQKRVHTAEQKEITVIGGFGTGKTLGVGMSAATWCAMTADFQFLNVAPKAWQSKLMYDDILREARGTRYADLIWKKPQRPYPKIVIRFRIGGKLYESSMEFMSADKNAQGILSWEGDWINIDEAGQLDNLEEVIRNLGSRLRGTVRGRERLGRFSMTSNSWDNYDLWYYFDMAMEQPDTYLSIQSSSRHNKNITPEQLTRMTAKIPKDERERFIDGARPEGRGRYFSKQTVYDCEIKGLSEIVEAEAERGTPHYEFETLQGAGPIRWQTPPRKNRLYMLFGDPGVGNPPYRNAPVLIMYDVTDFPGKPARIVSFWWGYGGGRITPFVERMFRLLNIYKPVFCGIDSTGPQKNINTLINEYAFANDFEVEGKPGYISPLGIITGISGLDFSGSKKGTYLNALRLFIEAGLMEWPREIIGIRSQLTNYDPERDKKIAQDIVATMSMGAYAIRIWFHVDPAELLAKTNTLVNPAPPGPRRLPEKARTRRANAGRGGPYPQ